MSFQSCRPEDFEAFVIRHENRLYRTTLAVMGNKPDAEDVVQEVFLRAYEKTPEFESEEHEKAWLIRVTVNLCNSRLRSPWRKHREPLLDSYPAAEPEQLELLEHVLSLPPKYRAVIHLFYYEGYRRSSCRYLKQRCPMSGSWSTLKTASVLLLKQKQTP